MLGETSFLEGERLVDLEDLLFQFLRVFVVLIVLQLAGNYNEAQDVRIGIAPRLDGFFHFAVECSKAIECDGLGNVVRVISTAKETLGNDGYGRPRRVQFVAGLHVPDNNVNLALKAAKFLIGVSVSVIEQAKGGCFLTSIPEIFTSQKDATAVFNAQLPEEKTGEEGEDEEKGRDSDEMVARCR